MHTGDYCRKWIEQGIGEVHDPEDFIVQSIEQKDNLRNIAEINQQLNEIRIEFDDELEQLKKNYDIKYDEVLDELREAEKELIENYEERSDMPKEELSAKILSVRERYESEKEDVLEDKINDAKKLERHYEKKISNLFKGLTLNLYVEFTTNSNKLEYVAILRE